MRLIFDKVTVMKKILLFIVLLLPFMNGCTLLGFEATKTETVSSTQGNDEGRYNRLETRVEELERRISILERKAADSD